jgi:hypothetical protein
MTSKFHFLFVILSLFVGSIVFSCTRNTDCDCSQAVSGLAVEVVETDGTALKWDAQVKIPSYIVTFTDSAAKTTKEYYFSQDVADAPKHKFTYDEFFKKGNTYSAVIRNDCEQAPAVKTVGCGKLTNGTDSKAIIVKP